MFLVDGKWSEWGAWSDCTKTCDGGKSTKERTCSNPAPTSRGKPCRGSDTKKGDCNTLPCKGNYLDIPFEYTFTIKGTFDLV